MCSWGDEKDNIKLLHQHFSSHEHLPLVPLTNPVDWSLAHTALVRWDCKTSLINTLPKTIASLRIGCCCTAVHARLIGCITLIGRHGRFILISAIAWPSKASITLILTWINWKARLDLSIDQTTNMQRSVAVWIATGQWDLFTWRTAVRKMTSIREPKDNAGRSI